MTDLVRRAPARPIVAGATSTSTKSGGTKPSRTTASTADAVSGSTAIGAAPVKGAKASPKADRSRAAVSQERPNYTVTPRTPGGSSVTADTKTRPIRMPGVPTGREIVPTDRQRPVTMPGIPTGREIVPTDRQRPVRMPGVPSGLDAVLLDADVPANQFRRGLALDGEGLGPGSVQTTASTPDIIDGLAESRKLFLEDAEDGGGVTAQEGLAEAADAIENGSKSAADALQAAMPNLDDAGADELAKLMKTAAAAKGVSVAALVLSVGDVAMNWKNHGIDDPRTQDSLAGLVGGSAGAAIGMALAGPLGAALGGMIGSYLGPKVAEFARDLADKYGDDVKDAVKAMENGVKAVGESIADAADAIGGFISGMWGKVWGDGGIVDDLTPDLDIPFF